MLIHISTKEELLIKKPKINKKIGTTQPVGVRSKLSCKSLLGNIITKSCFLAFFQALKMKLKFLMHCLTVMLEITTDVKIVEGEVNEITTIKHILRNCFI